MRKKRMPPAEKMLQRGSEAKSPMQAAIPIHVKARGKKCFSFGSLSAEKCVAIYQISVKAPARGISFLIGMNKTSKMPMMVKIKSAFCGL